MCVLQIVAPGAENTPSLVLVALQVTDALRVPDQYATIQAAIDAAQTGDTVLVADGLHHGAGNFDLDYGGKNIVVRSENGPEFCTLSCGADGRGVYFHSGESADAVFEGFTIVQGWSDLGGAIRCEGECSPTIVNCVLTHNHADGYGGGLYVRDGASVTVVSCNVSENMTHSCDGGGIMCNNATLDLVNCLISKNHAENYGGGLFVALRGQT